MTELLAVVLICAATTAQPDCTRATALDVITIPVPTPMACAMSSQQRVARDELLGDGRYTVTRCERRAS